MHAFEKIFPAGDFALLALILGMPLLGAFVNGVFGKRLGKGAVRLMALSALGISFLSSLLTFAMLHAAQAGEGGAAEGGEAHPARFVWRAWEWLSLSRAGEAGRIHNGRARFLPNINRAAVPLIAGTSTARSRGPVDEMPSKPPFVERHGAGTA